MEQTIAYLNANSGAMTFLITAVYVVATIFICWANIQSANASKAQLKEMQRQFYSINRPIVSVEIVYLRRVFWALRFTNHGTQTAFNAKIILNSDFIESLNEPKYQEVVKSNNGKIRTIGINQSYDLFIGADSFRTRDAQIPIKGQVIYRGINDSVYAEDFEIETQNYATFFSVNTDNDDLMEKLKEQNKELKHINYSLSLLAEKSLVETSDAKEEK